MGLIIFVNQKLKYLTLYSEINDDIGWLKRLLRSFLSKFER